MSDRRRIIGRRADGAPIYALAGADGEVSLFIEADDEDTATDDTSDSDSDADDDSAPDTDGKDREDDGWPPSREEWQALRQTARRATAQAVRRKALLREHGIPLRGKGEGDASSDREAAIREARQTSAREQGLEMGLKRAALSAALRAAGWVGDNLSLAARMVDFNQVDVEIDSTGGAVVSGLDEQVSRIQKEIPAWFKQRSSERRVELVGAEVVDGGHQGAAPAPAGSWRTRLSDQLGGKRRG